MDLNNSLSTGQFLQFEYLIKNQDYCPDYLRFGWDLNPRMAVLQTAALDHFATKPTTNHNN